MENWFREAFDNMRRQEDMRAEARRFVDADAETKRALRVLERVGGGSGAGGRGHSWRKQWGEFELQWIGGWTDEGVHAEVDRDVLHDWSWRERLA